MCFTIRGSVKSLQYCGVTIKIHCKFVGLGTQSAICFSCVHNEKISQSWTRKILAFALLSLYHLYTGILLSLTVSLSNMGSLSSECSPGLILLSAAVWFYWLFRFSWSAFPSILPLLSPPQPCPAQAPSFLPHFPSSLEEWISYDL